jgi:predicted RNase H-like HicB family nuclease
MNINEAENIVQDWGKFLEVAQPAILKMFLSKLPESLLPHPKKQIKQALEVMINALESEGNTEFVETLNATGVWLEAYGDDQEAIAQANEHFNNPKFVKAFYGKSAES